MNTTTNREAALAALAAEHNFSPAAVETALAALKRTGGSAAQFNHPEMGGSVQWMRGGMTQIGEMSNYDLKTRVGALCADLSRHLDDLRETPDADSDRLDDTRQGGAQDWPNAWGSPSSAGGQNGIRYAFFPGVRRLVVEEHGRRTVYDTLGHCINGVSQQQGSHTRLAFSTSDGQVDLSDLRRVTDVDG